LKELIRQFLNMSLPAFPLRSEGSGGFAVS
jgi:hypothetical protein